MRSRPAALVACLAMVSSLLATASAGDEIPREQEISARLAGTAEAGWSSVLALSRESSADGSAQRVVLAREDIFVDTLTATALAGRDGAILLVPGGPFGQMPAAVGAEVSRLLGEPNPECGEGSSVYIVGGDSAVSLEVQMSVEALGYCYSRIAGADRYDTALLIADELRRTRGYGLSQAIIASGDNWPDALASGAYAAAIDVPILLTRTDELPPQTRSWLEAHRPSFMHVLGGEATVSENVFAELGTYRGDDSARQGVQRYAGPTRAETLVEAARWLTGRLLPERILLASVSGSEDWQLLLAASPLAARSGGVVVPVVNNTLPSEASQYLADIQLQSVHALGPADSISEDLLGTVVGDVGTRPTLIAADLHSHEVPVLPEGLEGQYIIQRGERVEGDEEAVEHRQDSASGPEGEGPPPGLCVIPFGMTSREEPVEMPVVAVVDEIVRSELECARLIRVTKMPLDDAGLTLGPADAAPQEEASPEGPSSDSVRGGSPTNLNVFTYTHWNEPAAEGAFGDYVEPTSQAITYASYAPVNLNRPTETCTVSPGATYYHFEAYDVLVATFTPTTPFIFTRWVREAYAGDWRGSCASVWSKVHMRARNDVFALDFAACPEGIAGGNNIDTLAWHWPTYVEASAKVVVDMDANMTSSGRCSRLLTPRVVHTFSPYLGPPQVIIDADWKSS